MNRESERWLAIAGVLAFTLIFIHAGQPRVLIQANERFITNSVLRQVDNHQGCEVCWSIRENGYKTNQPPGHPVAHFSTPFVPANEKWVITDQVRFNILEVEYHGMFHPITNVGPTLSSITNHYKLVWMPAIVQSPPPVPTLNK